MATYLELQNDVTRRVIDTPASIVAEVPGLVNKAIRKLEAMRNFDVMKYSVSFTTILSTRLLGAVPADFKEYRGHPQRVNQFGTPTAMFVAPNDEAITSTIGLDGEGGAEFIVETDPDEDGNRFWNVWPLSEGGSDWGDGEYRVTIPYWRYLPDLSAATDTNWFTTHAEDYVIYQATSLAFALDWDIENATQWAALAQKEYKDVKNTDASKVLSGVDSLVPRHGARDRMVRH